MLTNSSKTQKKQFTFSSISSISTPDIEISFKFN